MPSRALTVAVVLCLFACEYDLDVGPVWQIERPRVIGVRMEVVEPAPIWPERIGYDVADAAIAEALPGDLVELRALAVDAEGRVQAPESLDALWFQCGPERCRIDVPTCDSLEWTTDVACELGRGGVFAFPFPALGPIGFEERSMVVMGIIGRDPSVDAARCRAAFLGSTYFSPLPAESSGAVPDEPVCVAVEAHVLIGPRWVLQFEAAQAGLEPELPLEQIPVPLLHQGANRAPAPEPPTWLDAETKLPLEGSPPRVRPGQRITTSGPNWRLADRQLYVTPERYENMSYLFLGSFETRDTVYFASGPVRELIADGNKLEFAVDELPARFVIRVVMIVGDHRKREVDYGTIGMFVSELEVVP